MITERRLAKVEASLAPRAIVLRWLVEAREDGSLVEQARSITDLPVADAPLTRICRDAATAAREAMKGQPRQAVDGAVRRAVGDAVFLFVLVIQLNQTALETARLEGLRAAAVTFWMGALLGGPRSDDPDYVAELDVAWRRWRATLDSLATKIRTEGDARSSLEQRYLAGHASLFDDPARAWADLRDHVERLVRLAELLPPEIGQETSPGAESEDSVEAETSSAAEDRARTLADDARVKAFEMLDERPRAVAIMERRLRAAPETAKHRDTQGDGRV